MSARFWTRPPWPLVLEVARQRRRLDGPSLWRLVATVGRYARARRFKAGIRERRLSRADGSVLHYAELGPAAGPTVVYCHGSPGSRFDLVAQRPDLERLGVRVVTVERPGFGVSRPRPGRSLSDGVEDVVAVVEHLELQRVTLAGFSSGAPYVVGAATRLGDRVGGLAVVAGVTDLGWPEAVADYVDEDRAALFATEGPAAAVEWCERRYGVAGSGLLERQRELSAADTAALAEPAVLMGLLVNMTAALAQGVVGYAHDTVAEAEPWPFDLGAISAPSFVYHGEQDGVVPVSHGRHTASVIPGAQLTTWPDEGHLSAVRRIPAVLAALGSRRR